MFHRTLLSAVIFGLALSFAATRAEAAPVQGKSEWKGQYGYNDGREPVPFTWSVLINQTKFGGDSKEPATFGDGSAKFLKAYLVGTILGNHLSLIKSYDGSGGVSHSVRYSGDFSADGKEITGTWTLNGISGPFSVDLVSVTGPVPGE